jgi:hypothetical protein
MKLRVFATLLLIGCSSACSTVSLTESARLAQAGQSATSDLTAFYRSTATSLPAVLEMEILRSALEPYVSPPSAKMISDIERSELSISHRGQLAKKLNTLYGSLYELSATNYPGNVEKSVTGLSAEIAGFAEAIGQPNPIAGTIADIAPGVLGFITREAQKKRVARANLIVKRQLEGMKLLLAADSAAISAIRQETAAQSEKASLALWRTGSVSARQLLTKYMPPNGLNLVSDEKDFTAKNPKIADAVQKIITFRLKAVRADEEKKYAAFEEAVEQLSARHAEIAAGSPANLDAVMALVSDLNNIFDTGSEE